MNRTAELCARIGKIDVLVEDAFGLIEGLLADTEIFLVQARPQQRRKMECRR